MTQVNVKSASRIDDSFVRTVNFLRTQAGYRADVLLGRTPRNVTDLPADITRPKELRQVFPFSEVEKQLDRVVGDDSQVGTNGDIRAIAVQSDLQALCIRAAKSQYTSRRQRKLQAAMRMERHADDDGFWITQQVDKVTSMLQRMQS